MRQGSGCHPSAECGHVVATAKVSAIQSVIKVLTCARWIWPDVLGGALVGGGDPQGAVGGVDDLVLGQGRARALPNAISMKVLRQQKRPKRSERYG